MWLLWGASLALAQPNYDLGVSKLKEKDAPAAVAAFKACLAEEAEGSEAWVSCQWEMGWAHWVDGDWAAVVADWEAVKRVDPDHADLERFLATARDNLALDAVIAATRDGAASTFSSKAEAGATVRIRAVGDLMIGTDFPGGYLPPADGAQAFAGVTDWLSDADLTFGNLEGPLCDGGKTTKCKPGAPTGSCYAFRSPARYAPYYKAAGFDVMSTANNHAEDFGGFCREQTESLLDDLGIAHTGRPGDIASREVNGLKVAFIGFHTNRNSHFVNDHETAAAIVRSQVATHDVVVVSFHGGAEGNKAIHTPDGRETYYGENRGHLRAFTHTVIDAGADLVLGHGPHVLRGIEVYNDRLIAYSLGNFATYGRFGLTNNLAVGAVLEVTLAADGRFVGGKLLPTRQVGDGEVEKDPDHKAIDLVRLLSTEDFKATGVKVAQDGSLAAP